MAIEQVIGDLAVDLAECISKQDEDHAAEWREAAQALRLPFWDWADEKVFEHGVPEMLTSETICIKMPNCEEKQEVPNPLSYFIFNSIPDGSEDVTWKDKEGHVFVAYYAQWKRTYRHAESVPNPPGSGDDDMNKQWPRQFKEMAKGLRRSVGQLFTFPDGKEPSKVWDEFSNTSPQSLDAHEYSNAGSLEAAHNVVHNYLGGNGHMSNPDYAGFDPIFWLHHCNVDRILALWEHVYPDYEMGLGYPDKKEPGYPDEKELIPFTQHEGTYNLVYNARLDETTGLVPFRKDADTYWTSKDTRFLNEKYYSYPEVNGVKIGKPIDKDEQIRCRRRLRQYYGFTDVDPPRDTAMKPAFSVLKTQAEAPEGHTRIPDYRNLIIVVQANEFAFNGSYTINVYHVPAAGERTHIGSVAIFARQDTSACKACKERREIGSTIRGVISIPLDIAMKVPGYGDEESSRDSWINTLKGQLHVVIVDQIGKEVYRSAQGSNVASASSVTPSAATFHPEGASVSPAAALLPEVTLLSSAAAFSDDGLKGLKWFDWQHHGKLSEGGYHAF